jgi:hypothetical protein
MGYAESFSLASTFLAFLFQEGKVTKMKNIQLLFSAMLLAVIPN